MLEIQNVLLFSLIKSQCRLSVLWNTLMVKENFVQLSSRNSCNELNFCSSNKRGFSFIEKCFIRFYRFWINEQFFFRCCCGQKKVSMQNVKVNAVNGQKIKWFQFGNTEIVYLPVKGFTLILHSLSLFSLSDMLPFRWKKRKINSICMSTVFHKGFHLLFV